VTGREVVFVGIFNVIPGLYVLINVQSLIGFRKWITPQSREESETGQT
jgi:hypothetical protein